EGRDHRDAGEFGELYELLLPDRVEDSTPRDDDGFLRGEQHVQRLLRLAAGRGGFGDGHRLVGIDVEFDLGHLHIEWQVDEYRAGAPRTHLVEGALEHLWHLARFQDRLREFRHGRGDRGDVDRLKVFLIEFR